MVPSPTTVRDKGTRTLRKKLICDWDRLPAASMASTSRVLVPGGTLGRYRTIVSGAPQFTAGEEVVLFLGGRAPALPYVVRLGEGVFRVQQDPRTGERLVTRQPILGQSAEWARVVRGTRRTAPMSLATLGALVGDLMERRR